MRNDAEFSYVDIETPGDMSSIQWKSSSPPVPVSEQDYISIDAHFAALNFRDIMFATGKMPMDTIKSNMAGPTGKLGMEFSGVDKEGERLMGLTQFMVTMI